jgi:hypothetical protein
VIGEYANQSDAKAAKRALERGEPLRPSPAPFRRGAVVANDLAVLERLEGERAAKLNRAAAAFAPKAPSRAPLRDVGRLPAAPAAPAAPALNASERGALQSVQRSNKTGLLWHADAMRPSLSAIVASLAKRGVLLKHGAHEYYAPEYADRLEQLIAASARLRGRSRETGKEPSRTIAYVLTPQSRRVSDYDLRRQKVIALPLSIDPSKAAVGDKVSVFSYMGNEPDHAVLTGLPERLGAEPSVKFLSGSAEGMNRYVSWDRMFAGLLDPNINWRPWRR